MKKRLLKSKLKQIFLKHKLSKKHAEICSEYIIKAEILEARGHGLARLKMYCDRIKAKVINPKPKIKIKKISSSISYINADNSIGFISADIAIKQAIKNAKKTGIDISFFKFVLYILFFLSPGYSMLENPSTFGSFFTKFIFFCISLINRFPIKIFGLIVMNKCPIF